MSTLDDLKLAVLKGGGTQRGDVAYDFKNHTAVYEFKTEKGAQKSIDLLQKAGGRVLGKTTDNDGGVSIKAWDATNGTTYTLYVKPQIVQSQNAKPFIDQVKKLNDVKIDYVPPVDVKTGTLDFSEIDKAQSEVVEQGANGVKNTVETGKPTPPAEPEVLKNAETKTVVNQHLSQDNTGEDVSKLGSDDSFIPTSLAEVEMAVVEKGTKYGAYVAATLPVLKLVSKVSSKLKFAKAASFTGNLLKSAHSITNLAYEYSNKISFGLIRRITTPLRVPFDMVASMFSKTAAARNSMRWKFIKDGLGVRSFVNNWRAQGLKEAWKKGFGTVRFVADRTGRIASHWKELGSVLSKTPIGAKLVEYTSKISAAGIAAAIPRAAKIANISGWAGIAIGLLSESLGELVTEKTGNVVAGKTTTGIASGVGKGVGAAGLVTLAGSAVPVVATAVGASAGILTTIATVGAFIPGPGWIIAGAALAWGAYEGYNAYKKSK